MDRSGGRCLAGRRSLCCPTRSRQCGLCLRQASKRSPHGHLDVPGVGHTPGAWHSTWPRSGVWIRTVRVRPSSAGRSEDGPVGAAGCDSLAWGSGRRGPAPRVGRCWGESGGITGPVTVWSCRLGSAGIGVLAWPRPDRSRPARRLAVAGAAPEPEGATCCAPAPCGGRRPRRAAPPVARRHW
jgi:hypothetical protein